MIQLKQGNITLNLDKVIRNPRYEKNLLGEQRILGAQSKVQFLGKERSVIEIEGVTKDGNLISMIDMMRVNGEVELITELGNEKGFIENFEYQIFHNFIKYSIRIVKN